MAEVAADATRALPVALEARQTDLRFFDILLVHQPCSRLLDLMVELQLLRLDRIRKTDEKSLKR